MEKTIIQFEQTVQVTEDSWRIIRKTLAVNQDTTIHEIRSWAIKNNNMKEPDQLIILKAESI